MIRSTIGFSCEKPRSLKKRFKTNIEKKQQQEQKNYSLSKFGIRPRLKSTKGGQRDIGMEIEGTGPEVKKLPCMLNSA